MDSDAILMPLALTQLMYKFGAALGCAVLDFRLITSECDTCQPFGFRTFQAAVDKMYALEDVISVHVFSLEFSN